VWARNPTTRLSLLQTRWMPCSVASATSVSVVVGRLASSRSLRLAHRYSTRVQLGRIGRESLDTQPVALAVHPGPHLGAPMRRQPVPDEHDALAGVEAGQLLQHPDEGVGVVAGLLEMETEPGRAAVGQVAQGGGHGGPLPAEAVAQDRGAATR
jgi:hypothetical protein